jgi:UDP-N-acetylglucosamine/UDP-N-acetylgalactosamine diphosphorylase
VTLEKTSESVKNLLERHNQGHVLDFWGQLAGSERRRLLAQIEAVDFSRIGDWAADSVRKSAAPSSGVEFSAADCYGAVPQGSGQEQKYARAREFGRELIAAGKVAAFVVAGGQGTRLGFEGPKGDFAVSPVERKTLFQIFAETISAVSAKYNATCPWYVMTSRLNSRETERIFRRNDYYELARENVFMFEQGTLPNFGLDGRILMADKGEIACSPDGHGGSLKALYESGALHDMKKRGVEFISYFQVDNPLVNIFDPLFIGLHALDEAEMSSKALEKRGPKEKLGNFCIVDAKVKVIEYSDLPDELAERRNADGSLVFGLGSIAIHIINRSLVEKLNAKGFSLPLHRAEKKIAHIDQRGDLVPPSESDGIKLESFVFDALPLASNSIILETLRSEEFSPIKNAAGLDSAETARRMMAARAASWLEWAGVKVPRKADGTPACLVEIAPGFAVERGDIKAKLEQVPEIKPGDRLYLA